MTGASILLFAAGCAKDVILPVNAVCGDFEKEATEECDVESVGCVECKVARGWTCNDRECAPICGDDMTVGEREYPIIAHARPPVGMALRVNLG